VKMETTISKKKARAEKFRPLTGTYIESERWMLDRVLEDVRRNGRTFAVVQEPTGVSVWQK